MGEAETIVKGLTSDERNLVLILTAACKLTTPDEVKSLKAKRVVNSRKTSWGATATWLTPLGLEVRRHLLEGADNAEG